MRRKKGRFKPRRPWDAGGSTLKEIERYTKEASRKQLAQSAMTKLRTLSG
jgi:hypothetical protein